MYPKTEFTWLPSRDLSFQLLGRDELRTSSWNTLVSCKYIFYVEHIPTLCSHPAPTWCSHCVFSLCVPILCSHCVFPLCIPTECSHTFSFVLLHPLLYSFCPSRQLHFYIHVIHAYTWFCTSMLNLGNHTWENITSFWDWLKLINMILSNCNHFPSSGDQLNSSSQLEKFTNT